MSVAHLQLLVSRQALDRVGREPPRSRATCGAEGPSPFTVRDGWHLPRRHTKGVPQGSPRIDSYEGIPVDHSPGSPTADYLLSNRIPLHERQISKDWSSRALPPISGSVCTACPDPRTRIYHLRRIRSNASDLDAALDCSRPRTADVVVLAPGLRIPRIAMHRCSASTTTIAPRGSSLRMTASAI